MSENSGKNLQEMLTTVNKGERFHNQGILEIHAHLNLLRLLNTRIFLPVALTGSEKVS